MAVIFKCDLCGKSYQTSSERHDKSPLHDVNFEYPDAEYSGWKSEICDSCLKGLKRAIEKAKYEYWNIKYNEVNP